MDYCSQEQLNKISHLIREIEKLSDIEKLFLYIQLPCSRLEGAEGNSKLTSRSNNSTNGTITNNNNSTDLFAKKHDQETTQTYTWILSHLEEDPNVSLPKQEVYDEYRSFCQSNRFEPLCVADFGKAMKHAFPCIKPRRLGQRGNSRYCYSGLRKKYKIQAPNLPDMIEPTFCLDNDCSQAYNQIIKDCRDNPSECVLNDNKPAIIGYEVMNLKIEPNHNNHQQQQHNGYLCNGNGNGVSPANGPPNQHNQSHFMDHQNTSNSSKHLCNTNNHNGDDHSGIHLLGANAAGSSLSLTPNKQHPQVASNPLHLTTLSMNHYSPQHHQMQPQLHPQHQQHPQHLANHSGNLHLQQNHHHQQQHHHQQHPHSQIHNPPQPPQPQHSQQPHHSRGAYSYSSDFIGQRSGTPDDDDYKHRYMNSTPLDQQLCATHLSCNPMSVCSGPGSFLYQTQGLNNSHSNSGSSTSSASSTEINITSAVTTTANGTNGNASNKQDGGNLATSSPRGESSGTSNSNNNNNGSTNHQSQFDANGSNGDPVQCQQSETTPTATTSGAVTSTTNACLTLASHPHLASMCHHVSQIEDCASPFQSPTSTPYSMMGNYLAQDIQDKYYPSYVDQ